MIYSGCKHFLPPEKKKSVPGQSGRVLLPHRVPGESTPILKKVLYARKWLPMMTLWSFRESREQKMQASGGSKARNT